MSTTQPSKESPMRAGEQITLAALEHDHITRILATAATITEAAQVLGIDQATLYRKRKRWGLPVQLKTFR